MNKLLLRTILGAVLLGAFFSCSSYLNSQLEQFTTADLYGMIYDYQNQPCQGVKVTIDGAGELSSDVNGRFVLPNVGRGKHQLAVKKEDYEDAQFEIDFLNRTQIVYLKIYSFDQMLELTENALSERKWGQAEEFLGRASKISEKDPRLLYLRGVLCLYRDQVKDALDILLSIAAQNNAEPFVYLAIADIYEYKLKDLPNALVYLKKFAYSNQNDEVLARIKIIEKGK